METMLSLTVTNVDPNEFRCYGSTVYTNFAVKLARPDGVPVETRAQDWQIDITRYPQIAEHVEALRPLLTQAYLFEAQMATDPGQTYASPVLPEPDTATQPNQA